MLTCVHHISWIRPVEGGLHQCILCYQVVGRKDVYPKLEDLPPEVARRWEAHERMAAAAKEAAAAAAKAAALAAAKAAAGPPPAAPRPPGGPEGTAASEEPDEPEGSGAPRPGATVPGVRT